MKRLKQILVILSAAFLCFSCTLVSTSQDMKPHLVVSGGEAPVRPIDAREEVFGFGGLNTEVEQIERLLEGVQAGGRPDLNDPHILPRVRQTYTAAVGVLDRYVTNIMHPVERVHVIYDYLTYYVDYDYSLLERHQRGEDVSTRHDSFNLMGVFVNGKAVCQGITHAFTLLCAIEEIEVVEVAGWFYFQDGSLIRHAWNKVRLDGEWYNVDATAGTFNVTINGAENRLFTHAYLLASDRAFNSALGRHIFDNDPSIPAATKDYDLKMLVPELFVDSLEELNAFFDRVAASRRTLGRFELNLNFPHRPSDIENAYKRVKNRELFLFYSFINNYYVFLVYT